MKLFKHRGIAEYLAKCRTKLNHMLTAEGVRLHRPVVIISAHGLGKGVIATQGTDLLDRELQPIPLTRQPEAVRPIMDERSLDRGKPVVAFVLEYLTRGEWISPGDVHVLEAEGNLAGPAIEGAFTPALVKAGGKSDSTFVVLLPATLENINPQPEADFLIKQIRLTKLQPTARQLRTRLQTHPHRLTPPPKRTKAKKFLRRSGPVENIKIALLDRNRSDHAAVAGHADAEQDLRRVRLFDGDQSLTHAGCFSLRGNVCLIEQASFDQSLLSLPHGLGVVQFFGKETKFAADDVVTGVPIAPNLNTADAILITLVDPNRQMNITVFF